MKITYVYEDRSRISYTINYNQWQHITEFNCQNDGFTHRLFDSLDIATPALYDKLVITERDTIKIIANNHLYESGDNIVKINVTEFF